MDYYSNVGEETVKRWNINEWWELVNKLDDLTESIALEETVGDTLEYAIITNSSKIIMCMREMLILTLHGYPDGATSISRTIYEYFIVTKYLYEKKHDKKLLQRYYEDRKHKIYRCNKEVYDYSLKMHDMSKETYEKRTSKMLSDLKFDKGKIEKNEYWWVGNENRGFSGIQYSVKLDDDYLRTLYKRACVSIHASSTGASTMFGKNSMGGSVINTSTTTDGFASALLLGGCSLIEFVKIVCAHWEKGCVVDEELSRVIGSYYNSIFKIDK